MAPRDVIDWPQDTPPFATAEIQVTIGASYIKCIKGTIGAAILDCHVRQFAPAQRQVSGVSASRADASAALLVLRAVFTAPSIAFATFWPGLRPRPIFFAIARRLSE